MIKTCYLFLSMLLISFVVGCDKVIDIELKTIEPQYVIEGRVTDGLTPWSVVLSTTQNFEEDEAFKGVSGAKVVIKTTDKSIVLNEVTTGVYHSTPLKGIPGQTYQLTVNINGKVFTAKSKMPQASAFLNLYMHSTSVSPSFIKLGMVYEDIIGIKDFYWFENFVNGNKLTGFNVYNDEFNDGMIVNQNVVFTNPTSNKAYDIKKGDELRVDMLCIDPSVYTYLFSLENASGLEYNGTAPTNPASNISGGALGYFSAHTRNSKKIIVP
jgi:hypothetical protein